MTQPVEGSGVQFRRGLNPSVDVQGKKLAFEPWVTPRFSCTGSEEMFLQEEG